MQQKIEHIRRYFAGTPRVFAAALAMIALSMSLFSMVLSVNVVTVTDETDGENVVLLTANANPEEILQQAGFEATHADEVVYTAHSENTASIVIRRAFPVTLSLDGSSFTTEYVDGTVADLLAEAAVVLEGEDYVQPAPETALYEGLTVQVCRVTYEDEVLRAEVADEDVDAYLAGQEEDFTFLRSNAGIYNVTWRHRYVNNELESSAVVELAPVLTPRDEGSTEFLPGVPVSTIEGFEGVSLGADGVPTDYAWMMEGAVATAYSSSGGRGASGLGLYCGTVAVNPNVIPYGTRLYITSADNSFVYGYAIATDTGGAMLEGRVDIDLYFATNAECLRFGKRALNVYILDD